MGARLLSTDHVSARTRVRTAIVAVLVVLALAAALAASGRRPGLLGSSHAAAAVQVNVKDWGAKGDGTTNDTWAVQMADNTAAKTGGVVFFPSGTYAIDPIIQDSNVTFTGDPGTTLRLRNGASPTSMITSRIRTTWGNISKGSTLITVNDATGMVPGALVVIRGAGARSTSQTATLQNLITGSSSMMMLSSTKGFSPNRNYVMVDNEIMGYQSIAGNSMNNLQRGILGTNPVIHLRGATVSQLPFLYAKIVSVSGKNVTLDTPSNFTLRYANMYVGSTNLGIQGLVLDGNKPAGGSTAIPSVVEYSLARYGNVSGNRIINGEHGGVMFNRGTSDSTIKDNVLSNNGDPTNSMGAAIWLYQGALRNTVSGNQIDGTGFDGIVVDDRTNTSTEYDAQSNNNTIVQNVINLATLNWNSGISIQDGVNNVVRDNQISAPFYGISVQTVGQATNPPPALNNLVDSNDVTGDQTGLLAGGAQNTFQFNQIVDAAKAIAYTGTNNTYTGNTVG